MRRTQAPYLHTYIEHFLKRLLHLILEITQLQIVKRLILYHHHQFLYSQYN